MAGTRPPSMVEIAAAFHSAAGVNIRKLDPESEERLRGERIERTFTASVDLLRRFENPRIRSLGAATWDVFHHSHVKVVVLDTDNGGVPTLSFAVAVRGSRKDAIAFAPVDWAEMAEKEPTMQLGAVVMVGSQAVDFYNGRFERESRTKIKERALSYEAEYLRCLGPGVDLNDYQKDLLKNWPKFDRRFDYTRKPVTGQN